MCKCVCSVECVTFQYYILPSKDYNATYYVNNPINCPKTQNWTSLLYKGSTIKKHQYHLRSSNEERNEQKSHKKTFGNKRKHQDIR